MKSVLTTIVASMLISAFRTGSKSIPYPQLVGPIEITVSIRSIIYNESLDYEEMCNANLDIAYWIEHINNKFIELKEIFAKKISWDESERACVSAGVPKNILNLIPPSQFKNFIPFSKMEVIDIQWDIGDDLVPQFAKSGFGRVRRTIKFTFDPVQNPQIIYYKKMDFIRNIGIICYACGEFISKTIPGGRRAIDLDINAPRFLSSNVDFPPIDKLLNTNVRRF